MKIFASFSVPLRLPDVKTYPMKKHILLIGLVLLVVTIGISQKKSVQKELTPARGHYRQLAVFSSKPKSANEEIDKQEFQTDKETVERRLGLKPNYLQNVTVEDFKIPDVPANSSEQTRKEINYLLSLQKHRSKEDVRASLYMANVYYNLRVKPSDSTYGRFRRNLFQIGRSIGSWFNPETLPITADFMARVWQDASYFIWALKFKYARIRPYVIDPSVRNLEQTDWAAYPSGHAANSYINAFIYQELAPEFTDFFIKDAYDMAHSREIIGVHYPSDSEASRIFARQFVNKLFQNERFLADIELVKKEWAQKAKEEF
jgi:acid phosphatase (class A)